MLVSIYMYVYVIRIIFELHLLSIWTSKVLTNHGRTHHNTIIWSGQVTSACVFSYRGLEPCPTAPPSLIKLMEFRGYEMVSNIIFGPKRCFLRWQIFTWMNVYLSSPALISASQLFANLASHTLIGWGLRDLLFIWKNSKLVVGRKAFVCTVCSHLASLTCHLPTCAMVCWGVAWVVTIQWH